MFPLLFCYFRGTRGTFLISWVVPWTAHAHIHARIPGYARTHTTPLTVLAGPRTESRVSTASGRRGRRDRRGRGRHGLHGINAPAPSAVDPVGKGSCTSSGANSSSRATGMRCTTATWPRGLLCAPYWRRLHARRLHDAADMNGNARGPTGMPPAEPDGSQRRQRSILS